MVPIHRGTWTPQPFPSRTGESQCCVLPLLNRRPEPNPASGRNTHRWDGVPRLRLLLGLSTAYPASLRSASVVTEHLSD
jgi:hypothetical protein